MESKELMDKTISVVVDAQALKIKDNKGMELAVSHLSLLNGLLDRIKEEKDKVMRPLLDAVNAERARWKPAEKKLEDAIEIVRRKITSRQTELVKIEKKEEAKVASKIKAGQITLEKAVEKLEKTSTVKEVITDKGKVVFKTVQKFTVVDMKKLPIEYHLANEVEIRKLMLKGIKLSGVNYFEEQVPSNYI